MGSKLQQNESKEQMIVGGDLAEALKGNYRVHPVQWLKEAFAITGRHFWPLVTAMISFLAVLLVIVTVIQVVLPMSVLSSPEAINQMTPIQGLGLAVFSTAIAAPLFGGIILMGIRHSIDIPTKGLHIFKGFEVVTSLIAAGVITTLISQLFVWLAASISPLLGYIVTLYTSAIFCLAIPLVVERRISPLNAIYYSIRITHYHLPFFIALTFAFYMVFIMGLITYGLLLFVLIPYLVNLLGLVYRQVIGVNVRLQPPSQSNQSDDWTA
ncbi:MAG TPA: hypothetical protein DCR58_04500 [Idiomarina baltica]|jgi:hypothetical protein|uniref:Stress protein n=1 Tax=Idiomarina baltica TaxID=190892 RepID=A0A348WNB9_9GAMM|nr:hypothetical protein [Idiomarina baltica]|tara:strand:+ start:2268 stop:3071 length:804 start_codon:yes stop_codon:yes gene_type:complete